MKYRYLWITALIFILDHATKWIVRTRMDIRKPIEIIPDYLSLSYVQNSGVAFGFFAEFKSVWKPYTLAAMAIVAVIVILMYASRMPTDRKLLQVALAVTLGGILGNFIDRIAHGFVVDFIEFHIKESFYWPTFNVADSAITVGIGLLLLDTLRHPDVDEAKHARTEEKEAV